MSVINTDHMIARDPLIQGFTYDELNLGNTAFFSRTVTESDVTTFAGLTGDYNPVHVNQVSAEESNLSSRICHGAYTVGLVSAAIGTKMPGQGTIYISQTSKFTKMVHFGDTLTVKLEVIDKIAEKKRIKMKTEVFNQNDELVFTGEAVVLPRQ